jgi:4a-hydroxytetrahydrobiopterin dehydratase
MAETKPNAALEGSALETAVAKLPGWKVEGGTLTRTFSFPNFVEAMGFVQSLGVEAEQKQHHPDLDIRYNKVRVGLVTHDAGGITAKDLAMAETAETLASPLQGH